MLFGKVDIGVHLAREPNDMEKSSCNLPTAPIIKKAQPGDVTSAGWANEKEKY